VQKFLIIQTAFIGDVILATPVLEQLHLHFPDAQIDVVVRKGNEALLENHPFLNQVLVWDKKNTKYRNLLRITKLIRQTEYDYVINLQRFAASGYMTMRAKAKEKRGFDKNPFAFSYTNKYVHEIGNGKHEVVRNLELIADFTDDKLLRPKLHPTTADFDSVKEFQGETYICIAPTSVWHTKQLPAEKWIELINSFPESTRVCLLGGPPDAHACDSIQRRSYNKNVVNLAGKLSFLQSAALMAEAKMNYVNDSAPMHMASAMNAPTTAFFCSTIPEFGFGPLSDDEKIIQVEEKLDCRPCGLHGLKACPKGHFKCALGIDMNKADKKS
jgi:lipopolysaccharide heptosyltransferase II